MSEKTEQKQQVRWTLDGRNLVANYDNHTQAIFNMGWLFHDLDYFDDVEYKTAVNGLKQKLVDKVAAKSSTADKAATIHATWTRLYDERKWHASSDGATGVSKIKTELELAKKEKAETDAKLSEALANMAAMKAQFEAMQKQIAEMSSKKKGK
jgi:hypothetical protein